MTEKEKYNTFIYVVYDDPDFKRDLSEINYNPEVFVQLTTSKINREIIKTAVHADNILDCYASVQCTKCEYQFFVWTEMDRVGSTMREMGYEICYSGDIDGILCPVCGHYDESYQTIDFYAYPEWDISYYGEDTFGSEKFQLTYIPREIFEFDFVFGQHFRAFHYESEYNLHQVGVSLYDILGRCFRARKYPTYSLTILRFLEVINDLDFIGKDVDLDIELLETEIKTIITHEREAFRLELEKFIAILENYDIEEGDEDDLFDRIHKANQIFLMEGLGEVREKFVEAKEKFLWNYETVLKRSLQKVLLRGTSKHMQYVIFLSYYHKDRAVTKKIKEALESQTDYPEIDIKIWFDQEKFFTGDPMTKVPEAIWNDTQGLIALLSKDGLTKSKYMLDELRNGYQKYIVEGNWKFFPVKLGDFSDEVIPKYILVVKYLPYEDSEQFYKRLIRDICEKIGGTPKGS